MRIARRDLVRGLLGASLYAEGQPAPEESGIEHVVLVMMENRSFWNQALQRRLWKDAAIDEPKASSELRLEELEEFLEWYTGRFENVRQGRSLHRFVRRDR